MLLKVKSILFTKEMKENLILVSLKVEILFL